MAKAAEAGSNQSGTQNGTQTTTLDPAIAKLLGTSGSGGILGSLGNMANGGSNLSGIGNSFLNANGTQILNNGYATTNSLANDQYGAPTMQAAQVNAPSQNNVDLTPTFQNLLGGGDTSALLKSLQDGNALTNAQFAQNTGNVTDSLLKTVMPGIRSNSVLAGQYGGSRQGIAEGNAISDYTKQLTNGATQVGLANSANTSGQLANAYESGQSRALSAAQGLSAQQYGVAQQDAAARQAADIANMGSTNSTNALNASKMANGVQLQQGLLGAANGYGNSDLSRLGIQSSILAPFLGAGATTTTNNQTTGNVTQPLYQNTGGNMLGGAMMGGQLAGLLGGTNFNAIRNTDNYGTNIGNSNVFNVPSSVGNFSL
jgi:hypothetical protein